MGLEINDKNRKVLEKTLKVFEQPSTVDKSYTDQLLKILIRLFGEFFGH